MMPLLLAESATAFTAAQLGAALGILLFVLGIIVAWKKAFGHEPPLHKEYATRIELDKVEKTLKEDLTKQASARKKMHEEISDLQGEVRALQTSADFQTRQLTNLDAKMDQVLLRLPRTND